MELGIILIAVGFSFIYLGIRMFSKEKTDPWLDNYMGNRMNRITIQDPSDVKMWSPDGTRVLFQEKDEAGNLIYTIKTVDPDTMIERRYQNYRRLR